MKPFADWVAASANVNRLPDEVAGVWFSVPELDLNAPLIYFIGSRSFRDKEGHEWACDAYWAQARRRSRSKVHEGPDRARLRPPAPRRTGSAPTAGPPRRSSRRLNGPWNANLVPSLRAAGVVRDRRLGRNEIRGDGS